VFEAIPGLAWIAIASTLWASAMLYRSLMRAFAAHYALSPERASSAPAERVSRVAAPQVRTVAAMFVLSGFA